MYKCVLIGALTLTTIQLKKYTRTISASCTKLGQMINNSMNQHEFECLNPIKHKPGAGKQQEFILSRCRITQEASTYLCLS